ncbi:MAG: VanZ family protein [Lachnospiraceae bacterium]|nr:VanZ family protein [Lachnospiraceae bacterium]
MRQWGVRLLFMLYCLILFYVLFGVRIQYGGASFSGSMWEYAKMHINFIPIKTIGEYIRAAKEGTINIQIILKNLLGNLLLFFPMGIYWAFRRKEESIGKFILNMLMILLMIELLQFLTKLGSFDVDDFILNLTGSLGGFWLGKIANHRIRANLFI